MKRQFDSLTAHVERLRPDAELVPILAGAEMRAVAQLVGAATRDWSHFGGSRAILAVAGGVVEVWRNTADAAPRWSIALDDVRVFPRAVEMGRTWRGFEIADGLVRVVAVPRFGFAMVSDHARGDEFVERAITTVRRGAEHTPARRTTPPLSPVPTRDVGARIELAPGPSVSAMERLGGVVVAAFLLAVPVALVGALLPGPSDESWVVRSAMATFFVSAFMVGASFYSPLLLATAQRGYAEYALGYTTARAAWTNRETPLDVVDAKTRRVVRPAGEALLRTTLGDQQKRLLQRAKEVAREAHT